MEKKYGIGLCAGAVLILAILSWAYYADYNYQKELARAERTEKTEPDQTVVTQGTAQKEEIYYLKSRNGYVIVYLDDQKSIYEYTDIRMEDLPEKLQKEIGQGKKLEGKNKLYGFLENYSS